MSGSRKRPSVSTDPKGEDNSENDSTTDFNNSGTVTLNNLLLSEFQQLTHMEKISINIISLLQSSEESKMSINFLLGLVQDFDSGCDVLSALYPGNELERLDKSMLCRIIEPNTILAHIVIRPWIQKLIRMNLAEQGRLIPTVDKLLSVFKHKYSNEDVAINIVCQIESVWNHAAQFKELVLKYEFLPQWLFQKYIFNNNHDRAMKLTENTLKLFEVIFGKESRQTLKALSMNGVVLMLQEEFEKAFKELTNVLQLQTSLLGEDHVDCCLTEAALGDVSLHQMRYDEAMKWYGKALGKIEKVFGPTHTFSKVLKTKMALVSQGQDNLLSKAEQFQVDMKAPGGPHPMAILNFGIVQWNLKNYEEALNTFKTALKILEKNDVVEMTQLNRVKFWIRLAIEQEYGHYFTPNEPTDL